LPLLPKHHIAREKPSIRPGSIDSESAVDCSLAVVPCL
jgi:hypothetical protein